MEDQSEPYGSGEIKVTKRSARRGMVPMVDAGKWQFSFSFGIRNARGTLTWADHSTVAADGH